MAENSDDPFVPIKDEDGNPSDLIDRRAYPTQASLDAMLARVTRVRVVPVSNYRLGETELVTLLDTSDIVALATFRECFAVVEDPETFGACGCFGNPHFELFVGDERIATIGYHHGQSIRWSAWQSDAWLREPNRLLDWLSSHGVHGPRQEVEESERRAEESRRQGEQWLAATPACLQPFWPQMRSNYTSEAEVLPQLRAALHSATPDEAEQARVLFGWFGSGVGLWSGYSSYESYPEGLLLEFDPSLLVSVLTATPLTEAEWRGAARYFGGWDYRQTRKGKSDLLSAELKARLLAAATSTGLQDTIERAQHAFGK